MKTAIIGLALTLITSASFAQTKLNPPPKEITLTHRILGDTKCANSTCYYDLYDMTQVYGQGLSIEFGNDWGENKFCTEMVSGEVARIVDLGEMSCSKIESQYGQDTPGYPTKEDRTLRPMIWLTYSKAWSTLLSSPRADRVLAKKGHCYLMEKSNTEIKVIVAFHVKDLERNKSVTLDEIEVFQRAEIVEVK